jgi:hypothetical protein
MAKLPAALLVCVGLFAAGVEASEVYEWLDANGVEHMADTPPPADQDGVELLRVNGNDVNSFHTDPIPTERDPQPSVDTTTARPPGSEEDCAKIHGRACSWDEHWQGYAERSCARVGDGHCHDEQHLKTHYDPRIQARHVAGHAHRHR